MPLIAALHIWRTNLEVAHLREWDGPAVLQPCERAKLRRHRSMPCPRYQLAEDKAKELYFQGRSFGYAVLQLIIARLLENQEHSTLNQMRRHRRSASPMTRAKGEWLVRRASH
jgi:hypothetical protein